MGCLNNVWVNLGQSLGDPDYTTDVFSGGPDACDPVLLFHLSINRMALKYIFPSAGIAAHARRVATAVPSGQWLRVAAKATPPTYIREELALGGGSRPSLDLFMDP